MDPVLATKRLSFAYGRAAAVTDVDLTLHRGEVFGFVGPNGAGKTTTIKLLLGLLTPTRGDIRAFGHSMTEHRADVLRRIGALVEAPAVYGHLTADENLAIQRLAHGVPAERVPAVLALVGLQDTRGKKVRHFSLGMTQRLGIAMALLHEPELLVLDEPANGLDPEGIQDLRRLLKRLAGEQQMTVFVSSHILAELEQTATRIAVITGGRLRYQGSIDALKASQRGRLLVTVDRQDDARAVVERLGLRADTRGTDALAVDAQDREQAAAITTALVGAGLRVYQVVVEQPNLEDVFLDLVRRYEGKAAA
jgi:lantibiotic transport system ATP-binding protein